MQAKISIVNEQEYNNTIYIIFQVPFTLFIKIVNYDNELCKYNYVNHVNSPIIWGVFGKVKQDIVSVLFFTYR